MVQVIYRYRNGTENPVDLEEGDSLMVGAVFAGIKGIDGNCGGTASCGTCHVLVDQDWLDRCGTPGTSERERLSHIPGRESNSRLSCQIVAQAGMEGLRVTVANE